MRGIVASGLIALAVVAGGCPNKATITPPPPPHMPKERIVPTKQSVLSSRVDCDPVIKEQQPAAVKWADRSIDEADNLARQGLGILFESEDRQRPLPERQTRLTQAVDIFLTALAADPYNVHATYNLAAAYARINRRQCAVNLLERLVYLRQLPSQKSKVDAKLDRLLGRGEWKGNLDPDFYDMRDDPRFRDLVKSF